MDQSQADYTFLEFGLLLMITGLFLVVFVTGLVFILLKESTIASSLPLAAVSVSAVIGLFAFSVFLLRRLKRFIVHR